MGTVERTSREIWAWQTVYSHFRKWKEMGVFEAIFHALSIDADFENINVLQGTSECQWRGKAEDKAVGMSRGSKNTKIHTLVDGLGNPLAFMLSSGADHDSTHAVPLLRQIKNEGSNILGGKAYGAKAIREYITSQDASYTIPPRENGDTPWPVDWYTYKECHLIECFFKSSNGSEESLLAMINSIPLS